jgi:hypothetical protein
MQQAQPFALPASKIGRPRRFQNLVGIARDEGIQMLVRFRARQETDGKQLGRYVAIADGGCCFGEAQLPLVGHVVPPFWSRVRF